MLAFDRYGQGATTVALLHGIGGGRSIWSDAISGTARRLSDAGCTVVALDLPGYGGSPLPATLTTPGMATAARDTLDELGLLPAIWLGHSMGGMVAQELVALDPAAVRGLVLACTSPAFGNADSDWQRDFLRDRLAPLDAGQGMAALASTLVAVMVAAGTPPEATLRAASVMARVPEATYRAALVALAGFDRRAALAQVAVPTLVLAAEQDRQAPPEMMRRMAQRIPGADYRCLAGAGHLANVERPDDFHAAVAAFLHRYFSELQAER
jgi:3-oxoadipate enol-lactonase